MIKIKRKDNLSQKQRDNIILDSRKNIKYKSAINLAGEITSKERIRNRKLNRFFTKGMNIAKVTGVVGMIIILITIGGKLDNKEQVHAESGTKIVEKVVKKKDNYAIIIADLKVNADKYKDSDSYVISETIKFLAKHEGIRYKAYYDFKQTSICFGNKSTPGATATHEECETMLRIRVKSELERINKTGSKLTSNQKIALISAFYNLGFKKDILNYAIRGDDKSVVYLLSLYNTAGGKWNKGLQARRYEEIRIYKS